MKKLLLVIASVFAFSISAYAAVDLNTASQSELETVKGIGPKKAQAIIEYRKKNGNFKSVDDLDKVPGFGKKTVTAVKKDITVGSATAAAAGTPEKTVKETKETTAKTVGSEQAASSGKTAESKTVKAVKEKGAKKK